MRENVFVKYCLVLVFLYNDLKEIGFLGWEVLCWIDWMWVRYIYDVMIGYFYDDWFYLRNIREFEKVYFFLYFDDCNGDMDLKVIYGFVFMVWEFDWDEIMEGDLIYERLF